MSQWGRKIYSFRTELTAEEGDGTIEWHIYYKSNGEEGSGIYSIIEVICALASSPSELFIAETSTLTKAQRVLQDEVAVHRAILDGRVRRI